jgi:hypothetical protein
MDHGCASKRKQAAGAYQPSSPMARVTEKQPHHSVGRFIRSAVVARSFKIAISCGWLLVVSVLFSSCSSGTTSAAVLCVGGVRISQAELHHWEPVLAALSPSAASIVVQANASGMTARQRALHFLEAATRTVGEAELAGVQVQNADVGRIIAGDARESGSRSIRFSELIGVVETSIQSQSDRVALVKDQLLAEATRAKQRSEAEHEIPTPVVASYYAEHKHAFVEPERRDVAVILTFHKRGAELAHQEIEAGKSLASVVQLRNEENSVGGIKRNLPNKNLLETFEANYFKAKPHVLIGPLKLEIYYLFEVLAIHPPVQKPLSEAEQGIRSTLVSHAQHATLIRLETELRERWTTRSRCGKG